ncbi:MarR family winged helix-turn-helix transcriptional regulator [Streptomyces sp. NPDC096132]|uniref:MarR family winged helix-turn-helix transcriptional regulator n=1 Tax=Streptomyces sp. NPDC096132 TaxID=3366075 RepID=UPI0038104E24
MREAAGPAAGLVRLSFLIQTVYTECSRDCGLTYAQAQLLCSLTFGPKGMAELCGVLGVERSSLTGLVDRAEQRDLVERRPDPADRRAVRVALTPSGEEAIGAFHRGITERLDALLADLPAAERKSFHLTLTKLTADAPPVFVD